MVSGSIDSSGQPNKKLKELSRTQGWQAATSEHLEKFVRHICEQSQNAVYLAHAHQHLEAAINEISHIEDIRTGLHDRIRAIQYELMGEKPPELSWQQWRNWNTAHFFRGKSKWTDLAEFFQVVASESVTPDALRVEYSRLIEAYGSLPLNHQLAVHLDQLRGHRRRSRLKILADRSAFPRLQLAIKRDHKRPAR